MQTKVTNALPLLRLDHMSYPFFSFFSFSSFIPFFFFIFPPVPSSLMEQSSGSRRLPRILRNLIHKTIAHLLRKMRIQVLSKSFRPRPSGVQLVQIMSHLPTKLSLSRTRPVTLISYESSGHLPALLIPDVEEDRRSLQYASISGIMGDHAQLIQACLPPQSHSQAALRLSAMAYCTDPLIKAVDCNGMGFEGMVQSVHIR